MRIASIAVVLGICTPVLLSAQSMSRSTSMSTRPETTFVRGTVTGDVPMGTNFTIDRSTTSYYVIPAPTTSSYNGDVSNTSSTNMSSMSSTSTSDTTSMTTSTTPRKKTLDRKISHGVGEAAGDASKLGKKAAHGVKKAASDVKKKVTGKP